MESYAPQGFGEGPVEAEWVAEIYRRVGLGDDGPWRHYLGRLGGEPVATSTLFPGAALTPAPLHEAREMGYRLGVLGSSEMGYPVYRRLGFREHCRIGLYEW